VPLLSSSDLADRRAEARRRERRRRALGLAGVIAAAAAIALAIVAVSGSAGRPGDRATVVGVSGVGGGSGHGAGGGAGRSGAHHARAAHTLPAAAKLPPITPPVPGPARVYKQGPARNEIALTFDDGFCPACVARILHTLERTGAHATIFPNGTYSSSWDPQAALVRRLVARGQLTVGNHTFLHHDALEESPTAFETDLVDDERWIERTFGVTARPFFRPPYGAYNASTLQIAGQNGYRKVIYWSGTLADSSPRSIPYILGAIRYWAHPGAIILMHGNYPNTSIALPQILAIVKARGLRPVTLAELLGTS
jgi:peptidoglycan/xylan/chitin deacetylase (PgdA/CDA1 family)